MYYYFVSYACADGFGNIRMGLSEPITHSKHIRIIEGYLRDQENIRQPVVLFYSPYKTKDQTPNLREDQ